MGLRVLLLLAHTVLDALPIAAFLAAVSVALPAAELPRLPRLGALVLINAHVFTAVTLVAFRLILAPDAHNLRVLAMEDRRAREAYRWARWLATVGIYGYMLASSAVLFGLPRGAERLALALVGLVLLAMAGLLVIRLRRRVAAVLRGKGGAGVWPRLRAIAAVSWHVAALAYLTIGYLVWASGIKGSFLAFVKGTASMLVIFAAAALLAAIAKRLLGGLTPSEAARARLAFLESRMSRGKAVILGAIRAILYAVAAVVTLEAWGFRALKGLRSDLAREAGVSFVTILGVVFLAFLLWEAAGAAMDHRLETAPPAKRNKLRTIFPLLKRGLLLVIGVMVAFTMLSEFGVNIAPLLAGAGVIGIAVGLGAQSFAKDFLKGITILLEDSIAVGDVVGVGGKTGLVEELHIGSVRLRDYDGTVYVVPFSEVTTVVNMTKDFSYAVLDVAVAYKEDPDRVMEVMAEVVEEMRKDEKFSHMILEPIDVAGVDQFGDSAVSIRARVKTRPIMQWNVAREFRRRLKKRFDDLGIEIPFPQRTLRLAGPWPGMAEEAEKKDKA